MPLLTVTKKGQFSLFHQQFKLKQPCEQMTNGTQRQIVLIWRTNARLLEEQVYINYSVLVPYVKSSKRLPALTRFWSMYTSNVLSGLTTEEKSSAQPLLQKIKGQSSYLIIYLLEDLPGKDLGKPTTICRHYYFQVLNNFLSIISLM